MENIKSEILTNDDNQLEPIGLNLKIKLELDEQIQVEDTALQPFIDESSNWMNDNFPQRETIHSFEQKLLFRQDNDPLEITPADNFFTNSYRCAMCGETFDQVDPLNAHCTTCVSCKQKSAPPTAVLQPANDTSAKLLVKAHTLKTHSSPHSEQKRFKCDVCQKVFRYECKLVSHRLTHTAIHPPYECDLCGKKFSLKQKLNVHKQIHTGGQPTGFSLPEVSSESELKRI